MNTKKYKITLSDNERSIVQSILSEQKEDSKVLLRANILQLSDTTNYPELSIQQIADEAGTTRQTVTKIRNIYHEQGFDIAINVLKKTEYKSCPLNNPDFLQKILDIIHSSPTNGRSKWSLRSIGDECVKRGYVDYISPTTISKILAKNNITL